MRSSWLMFLYYIIINRKDSAYAIPCYDCRADDGSCNVGECKGMVCVKMETANMDNDRSTVHKSCSDEYEETGCKQSGFGNKVITRCTCETSYCNGDESLVKAGLLPNGSISNRSIHLFSIFIFSFYYFIYNPFIVINF